MNKTTKKAPTHVDDFVDSYKTDKYASWFFALHRFPAILQGKFREWIDQYKLFCDFEGKRWRVVGASRMGDVWLTEDFESEQYTRRVMVDDCGNWGPEP